MTQLEMSIEQFARMDPVVAPLARVQAIALREADDPCWEAGVPTLPGPLSDTAPPLLHGATLRVNGDRVRTLIHQIAAALDQDKGTTAESDGASIVSADVDPLDLVRATVMQQGDQIASIAVRIGADPAVLAVVAHTAALPLLLACGRRAAETVASGMWPRGYCPVCAAWPTLAEVRGLARDIFRRCGRCGSGWRSERRGCAFCGSQDHKEQGYFAAEHERESRRAAVCDACRGYLKMVTTLGPLTPAEVLLRDLQSLELDVTALEHEYSRPDGLGSDLAVTIEAAAPPSVALHDGAPGNVVPGDSRTGNGREGRRADDNGGDGGGLGGRWRRWWR